MNPLDIRRGARFNHDRTERHELTREWGPGPRMCVIAHNPSEGSDVRDDPTIQRWMFYGEAWGYGSLVAVNMLPLVTPAPAACYERLRAMDPTRRMWMLLDNRARIIAAATSSKIVLASWGNLCELPDERERIITALHNRGISLYCFGRNKDGSPKHVMARGQHRIPNDAQPEIWSAAPPQVETPAATRRRAAK